MGFRDLVLILLAVAIFALLEWGPKPGKATPRYISVYKRIDADGNKLCFYSTDPTEKVWFEIDYSDYCDHGVITKLRPAEPGEVEAIMAETDNLLAGRA